MVRYTEIFKSIQGEALHTGKICTWLRLFACSLQCRGFGQVEPGNPDTWVEQRLEDPKLIYTDLQQVPTPSVGCDSDYSWSAKFKHLIQKDTPIKVAEKLVDLTRSGYNRKIGHIFTGGEPLMQQENIVEILAHWLYNDVDGELMPKWIGFETNATQVLSDEMIRMMGNYFVDEDVDIYFSISPKLLHVAGEKPEKAIKLDVIKQYLTYGCSSSYLKFVLNEDQRAWDQAYGIVKALNDAGYYPDVWVMPVGGTPDQQAGDATGRIADKAINEYEWNVSPRVHLMVWGDEQMGR